MIDKIQGVSSLSLTRGLDGLTGIGSEKSSIMGSAAPTPGQNTGLDFASIMGNMATDAMDTLKKAEASSFAGIEGKANTREVVDAVLQAQQSLQTAIAFRDKIVSAYLEITKMQI
jgi:flagellar hook-basal body complex protein FliE